MLPRVDHRNETMSQSPAPQPLRTSSKRKSGFAADVLRLITGTASAQVLTIVTMPVIARLFPPEAFGVAALLASVVAVTSMVVGLRYELAIQVAESDEDAANALVLTLIVVLALTAGFSVVLWLAKDFVLSALHNFRLGPYLWLIPLGTLLGGISSALNNWSGRERQFTLLTWVQIASAISAVAAKVAFGFAGIISGGVFYFCALLGNFVGCVPLVVRIWQDRAPLFIANVNLRRIVHTLRRFRNFPRFSVGTALLNSVSWQVPSFLLALFFSPAVLGSYWLAKRTLRAPMNLLGVNVAKVFFCRAAEARFDGTLSRVVENTFRYLASLSVFPSLLLALVARDLTVVVFGPKWSVAGTYMQILSLSIPFWFVAGPMNTIFAVLEQQALELRLQVFIFGTRLLGVLIGCLTGNAMLAIALFSAAGVLGYGSYCVTILRHSGVSVSRMSGILFTNFLLFIPAGIVVAVMKWMQLGAVLVLVGAGVLLVLFYLNAVRTDPIARKLFGRIVQRWALRTS
jgi:O-antigen/teichoic acid export membrane protein